MSVVCYLVIWLFGSRYNFFDKKSLELTVICCLLSVVCYLFSVVCCQFSVIWLFGYLVLDTIFWQKSLELTVICCLLLVVSFLFSVFCFRLFGFKKNRTFFFKKPYHLYIILLEIANSIYTCLPMKKSVVLGLLLSAMAMGFTTYHSGGKCTGSASCKACKNCKYCKHCAKNGGTLQPLIPVAGVVPVTESEIIEALGDKNALVVDMRDPNDRVKGTIPGSISIPYTEVAMRMDELGCKKLPDGNKQKWDCSKAKKVYGFCNGPVCPQSPSAMNAMVRDGFPASKIYYYRGGMLDWDALGLTSVKDEF